VQIAAKTQNIRRSQSIPPIAPGDRTSLNVGGSLG